MNVTIVGLGKIGVPLAVQFALKGATVVGYDLNAERVAQINGKHTPLPSEPGLETAIPGLVVSERLRATTDPRDAVGDAEVVVLIVPVDIDAMQRPDFTLLDSAVDAIAPHLKRGVLIIVETTVPIGTPRHRVGGRVAAASALTPPAGFSLAFSPERVSSGRVLRDLATYPKIVGGVDAHSTARAADFYRAMLDAEIMVVRDAETAEFSKLAETTYRDVNIALANEFARVADAVGVDALQAIAAANSQPYSHIHAPGPGVGGHCIPVYPYFISAPEVPSPPLLETDLIATARRINDDMAHYAAGRLASVLGSIEGTTCLVLGLAYRAGVKEARHSSTFGLVNALSALGAEIFVHDPLYSADEIAAYGLTPAPPLPLACDAIVVQAWHEQYGGLDFGAFDGLRAVLDPRAAIEPAELTARGLVYVGVGR